MKKYMPYMVAGIIIIITIIASIIALKFPRETTKASTKIYNENYDYNNKNNVEKSVMIININELEDENIVEEELQPIDEEKIKKEAEQTINTTMPYYIKVNCEAQVVNIYKKDENEEYTIPAKAMICSTGASTPSSGVYSMPGRRTRWRNLYGGVTGQYVTNIVGAILFHSVPYLTYGDNGSLEYWEYDKLGTDASMGCVRLTVRDAKWIYENCGAGTQVEFYMDSNPGPLGKPSARKISSNVECRDWDPTDPDSDNPWHTWKEKTPVSEVENKQLNNEINTNSTTTTTTNLNTNNISENTENENVIKNKSNENIESVSKNENEITNNYDGEIKNNAIVNQI